MAIAACTPHHTNVLRRSEGVAEVTAARRPIARIALQIRTRPLTLAEAHSVGGSPRRWPRVESARRPNPVGAS